MDNYLNAGQKIGERLTSQVPELKSIYFVSSLDDLENTQRQYPCAFVIYNGDNVLEGQGRSSAREVQLVDQEWYAILAVHNVKTQVSGEAVRSDAGVLAYKFLKALQGWQPSVEHGPLTRSTGVRAGYKTGYMYLPFLFTTRITI